MQLASIGYERSPQRPDQIVPSQRTSSAAPPAVTFDSDNASDNGAPRDHQAALEEVRALSPSTARLIESHRERPQGSSQHRTCCRRLHPAEPVV